MLEVIRNYESALADSEFDVLYTCKGQECGNARELHSWLADNTFARGTTRQGDSPAHWMSFTRTNDRTRIYLLKQANDDITAHILLFMTRDWYGDVPVKVGHVVVEGEPMRTGQVEMGVRTATELQAALDAEGRAIVDGIFFDFDSAEIRPESAQAIEQMAALMNDTPEIQVYVVGHTDNQGSLDYNHDLSTRRAEAVRRSLAGDYGIDEERMAAHGVASLAPVASNSSEDGRALNRRVELVLQ